MIGLLLFLALAIPVAIHIFSRSEGKVVPFPFVGLLPTQVVPNELQVKLQQKRLLLIRLLLVMCACILVSAYLLTQIFRSPVSEHVLLTQDWWISSTQKDKQALAETLNTEPFADINHASLLVEKPNNQIILTNLTINKLITLATSNVSFDKLIAKSDINTNRAPASNLWAIAQAISSNMSEQASLHVFTTNRQSQFLGSPVTLPKSLGVHWHILDMSNNTSSEQAIKVKLALIGFKNDSVSALQKQRMLTTQRAIEVLASKQATDFGPISIDIEHFDTLANLSSAQHTYDAVLFDSIMPNAELAYMGEQIDISKLPPPSQNTYIFSLAQAIFGTQQQAHTLFNTGLSPEQIRANTKPVNADEGTSMLNLRPLPHNNDSPAWLHWIILTLLCLFVLERWLSERSSSVKASPATHSAHKANGQGK